MDEDGWVMSGVRDRSINTWNSLRMVEMLASLARFVKISN